MKRKKNIFVFVIGSTVLFLVFRLLPQFHIIRDFWGLEGVSISRKFEVLYNYTLGYYSLWHRFETTATIILSLATVINVIVFSVYYRRQKKVLNKGSVIASTTGMFLAVFGVGCISCGAIVLAPLLSAFGLLGSLSLLPFFGKELVVVGLVFVIGSTTYLLHQLKKPLVC